MQAFPKVGLEALLTPDNCVVVLIDHQPFQLANVNSHEPTMVINNAIGLAMTAKAYGIPTILTTVNEERGGLIFKGIREVFPDQKTINRTYINAWEDKRVVEGCRRRRVGKRLFLPPSDGDVLGDASNPGDGRRVRRLCRYGCVRRRVGRGL